MIQGIWTVFLFCFLQSECHKINDWDGGDEFKLHSDIFNIFKETIKEKKKLNKFARHTESSKAT